MSWWDLLKYEIAALRNNSAVMLTVFGGVLFYSFLYPLPYLHQVSIDQPVSVVNLDNSQVSRQLERMIDASPQVSLVRRAHSIEEAKEQLLNKEVSGIFVIPKYFYRDLLLSKSPTLSFAGDASYFLVYGTIVEGLVAAGKTLGAQAKVAHLIVEGQAPIAAAKQYSATHLNLKPTFNSIVGYLQYVVPAVFVLILQQTLIMGVGLMQATQKAAVITSGSYWNHVSAIKLLSARVFVFMIIYVLLSLYYFGFSFDYYQVSRLAEPMALLIVLVPFLLSSIFIGVVLAEILPRRELVTLVVLLSSMPLIFTAGFVWPVESIPQALVILSQIAPSTPAIKGFLGINQMGAPFSAIRDLWLQLWGLSIVWGLLAWYLSANRRLKILEKHSSIL